MGDCPTRKVAGYIWYMVYFGHILKADLGRSWLLKNFSACQHFRIVQQSCFTRNKILLTLSFLCASVAIYTSNVYFSQVIISKNLRSIPVLYTKRLFDLQVKSPFVDA